MRVVAIVVAITVVGSLAVASSAAAAGASSCGTATYSGKRWAIASLNVSCRSAKAVIKKLAPKVRGTARYGAIPGTFSGMRCVYAVRGRKAVLTCASTTGLKLVTAGAV